MGGANTNKNAQLTQLVSPSQTFARTQSRQNSTGMRSSQNQASNNFALISPSGGAGQNAYLPMAASQHNVKN